MERERVERDILKIVGRIQRDLQRGVFPWMVQARMDYYRDERTLRRDMMRLVGSGMLVRLGGTGARQGYRLSEAGRMLLHCVQVQNGHKKGQNVQKRVLNRALAAPFMPQTG